MTAAPLTPDLANVRKRLPLRLFKRSLVISLVDKQGNPFCTVPGTGADAMSAALLIRDAMNEME